MESFSGSKYMSALNFSSNITSVLLKLTFKDVYGSFTILYLLKTRDTNTVKETHNFIIITFLILTQFIKYKITK